MSVLVKRWPAEGDGSPSLISFLFFIALLELWQFDVSAGCYILAKQNAGRQVSHENLHHLCNFSSLHAPASLSWAGHLLLNITAAIYD